MSISCFLIDIVLISKISKISSNGSSSFSVPAFSKVDKNKTFEILRSITTIIICLNMFEGFPGFLFRCAGVSKDEIIGKKDPVQKSPNHRSEGFWVLS